MVITELKDKLDNEFQKHYNIILVNGTWGIGKTYYLKDYLQNNKYIYISLFGIDKLEGIKYAIYYELNKIGACINKFVNNNSNRDVGISFLTLPIPNISSDIQKKIEKKLKKESLILVIDDLERKSDDINTKELLGFIESLSEIENIKIIIVANEKYIGDKDVYDNFKEKVINKTYNITQYSNEAVNKICKQYIDNNSIEQIISTSDFFDTVIRILTNHKIKNLRTLKKAILYSKIFLTKFDNNIIKEHDKLDLIKICFAVVIEDCDNLYLKNAKGKSLETANTTVSGCEAASLLKRLTDAAHTLVSKLGKTFITTFFPFKSLSDNSDKSLFTPLKSGASVPTFGNSPFV